MKSVRLLPILALSLLLTLGQCFSSGTKTQPAFSTPLLIEEALGTQSALSECPANDCAPELTATPATPLRFSLPTPGIEPVSAWRPPLYPIPWSLFTYDHYYFARPIGADQVNWPLANYRYGGVFFAPNVVHTGVDIPAKKGTPVLAAASGTVTWADWGFFSGVPGNLEDPYGIATVIEHDFGYLGQPLYTVYAHMDTVEVVAGQFVNKGDLLGTSGETGQVTGPHVHFEVRLGENTFFNTRNPELWIAPPQGWGVLTGRILTGNGQRLSTFEFTITSLETSQMWKVRTYGVGAAESDDYYNENFVLGDLPAGRYVISIQLPDAVKVDKLEIEILAGRTAFFTYRNYTEGEKFDLRLPTPSGLITPQAPSSAQP